MEWLQNTQDILSALGFSHIKLVSLILVILCPISFVYASGRGLNILKTKLQKNVLAIVLVITLSTLEVYNLIPLQIQSVLFLVSIGFFVYVVWWQKFYARADNRLDKMIGEDEEINGNGFIDKKTKKRKA
jgi:hypothetical protein